MNEDRQTDLFLRLMHATDNSLVDMPKYEAYAVTHILSTVAEILANPDCRDEHPWKALGAISANILKQERVDFAQPELPLVGITTNVPCKHDDSFVWCDIHKHAYSVGSVCPFCS